VIAEQNFDNTNLTLDSTFLAYERSSVLMDFLSKCPNPTPGIVNDAKAGLLKCIYGCIALEGDTESQRYVKKHHFALIKIAMLLLDCRTASGTRFLYVIDRGAGLAGFSILLGEGRGGEKELYHPYTSFTEPIISQGSI
jgi:hypothetical protein